MQDVKLDSIHRVPGKTRGTTKHDNIPSISRLTAEARGFPGNRTTELVKKKKKIKTKGFSLLKARIHWYYSPSPRLSIHDEISDIKAHMMHEYFHRVTILLIILSLKSESLTYQTACSSNEARVELTARLFRTRAQRTFFDIRVFEPIIGVNIRGRS